MMITLLSSSSILVALIIIIALLLCTISDKQFFIIVNAAGNDHYHLTTNFFPIGTADFNMRGAAYDPSDECFIICAYGSHRLYRFFPHNASYIHLAGTGSTNALQTGGVSPPTAAQIESPFDVAVLTGTTGNVVSYWFSMPTKNALGIIRLNLNQLIAEGCGKFGQAETVDDRCNFAGRVNEPHGITFYRDTDEARSGSGVFFADKAANVIRVVYFQSTSNMQLKTIAGDKTQRGTADGSGTNAQFEGPFAVAVYPKSGNDPYARVLFVSEHDKARLRKILSVGWTDAFSNIVITIHAETVTSSGWGIFIHSIHDDSTTSTDADARLFWWTSNRGLVNMNLNIAVANSSSTNQAVTLNFGSSGNCLDSLVASPFVLENGTICGTRQTSSPINTNQNLVCDPWHRCTARTRTVSAIPDEAVSNEDYILSPRFIALPPDAFAMRDVEYDFVSETFVFVSYGKNKLFRLFPDSQQVSHLAGTGTTNTVSETVSATSADLKEPFGVTLAFSSTGARLGLLISLSGCHCISYLASNQQLTTCRCGVLDDAGIGDGDCVSGAVKFSKPYGLSYFRGTGQGSSTSYAFIADHDNHRIRALYYATDGTLNANTLAGSGTEGESDGDGTSAQFSGPIAVAAWPKSSSASDVPVIVFVSEKSGRLRKIRDVGWEIGRKNTVLTISDLENDGNGEGLGLWVHDIHSDGSKLTTTAHLLWMTTTAKLFRFEITETLAESISLTPWIADKSQKTSDCMDSEAYFPFATPNGTICETRNTGGDSDFRQALRCVPSSLCTARTMTRSMDLPTSSTTTTTTSSSSTTTTTPTTETSTTTTETSETSETSTTETSETSETTETSETSETTPTSEESSTTTESSSTEEPSSSSTTTTTPTTTSNTSTSTETSSSTTLTPTPTPQTTNTSTSTTSSTSSSTSTTTSLTNTSTSTSTTSSTTSVTSTSTSTTTSTTTLEPVPLVQLTLSSAAGNPVSTVTKKESSTVEYESYRVVGSQIDSTSSPLSFSVKPQVGSSSSSSALIAEAAAVAEVAADTSSFPLFLSSSSSSCKIKIQKGFSSNNSLTSSSFSDGSTELSAFFSSWKISKIETQVVSILSPTLTTAVVYSLFGADALDKLSGNIANSWTPPEFDISIFLDSSSTCLVPEANTRFDISSLLGKSSSAPSSSNQQLIHVSNFRFVAPDREKAEAVKAAAATQEVATTSGVAVGTALGSGTMATQASRSQFLLSLVECEPPGPDDVPSAMEHLTQVSIGEGWVGAFVGGALMTPLLFVAAAFVCLMISHALSMVNLSSVTYAQGQIHFPGILFIPSVFYIEQVARHATIGVGFGDASQVIASLLGLFACIGYLVWMAIRFKKGNHRAYLYKRSELKAMKKKSEAALISEMTEEEQAELEKDLMLLETTGEIDHPVVNQNDNNTPADDGVDVDLINLNLDGEKEAEDNTLLSSSQQHQQSSSSPSSKPQPEQDSMFERDPRSKWEDFLFWLTGFQFKWSNIERVKATKNSLLLNFLDEDNGKRLKSGKDDSDDNFAILLEDEDVFASLGVDENDDEGNDDDNNDQELNEINISGAKDESLLMMNEPSSSSNAKNNKKKKGGAKVDDSDANYVRRFKFFFHEYTEKCSWFAVVELTISFVLGILDGAKINRTACAVAGILYLIILVLYFVLVFYLKPFLAGGNLIFALTVAGIQFAAGIVFTIGHYGEIKEMFDLSLILGTISNVVIMGRVLIDLMQLFWAAMHYCAKQQKKRLLKLHAKRVAEAAKESKKIRAKKLREQKLEDDKNMAAALSLTSGVNNSSKNNNNNNNNNSNNRLRRNSDRHDNNNTNSNNNSFSAMKSEELASEQEILAYLEDDDETTVRSNNNNNHHNHKPKTSEALVIENAGEWVGETKMKIQQRLKKDEEDYYILPSQEERRIDPAKRFTLIPVMSASSFSPRTDNDGEIIIRDSASVTFIDEGEETAKQKKSRHEEKGEVDSDLDEYFKDVMAVDESASDARNNEFSSLSERAAVAAVEMQKQRARDLIEAEKQRLRDIQHDQQKAKAWKNEDDDLVEAILKAKSVVEAKKVADERKLKRES